MDRGGDRLQRAGKVSRRLASLTCFTGLGLGALLVAGLVVTPVAPVAVADERRKGATECDKDDDWTGECDWTPPDGEDDNGDGDEQPREPREGDTYIEIGYGNICTGENPANDDGDYSCHNARICDDPNQIQFMEYQRKLRYTNGQWVEIYGWQATGQAICRQPDDRVTEADVLAELREFGLRPAVPEAQPPDGKTLIDLKTIFYTEAEPYTFDLDLGPGVQIRATPERFHWDFGDGEDLDTDQPGRPYPHFDIWHKYADTGAVEVTLTVDYRVEWNPGGTGWNTIAETIPGQPSEPLPITVLDAGSVLYE